MIKQTFFIFRHAQAVREGESYGKNIVSASILEEYTEPIKRMAVYLKNVSTDMNISSEYLRCKQTAAIITDVTGKKFLFDKRLNEFKPGDDFTDCKKRVISFMSDISKSVNRNILLCTHGAIISAIRHLLLYKKLEEWDLADYPEPGVLWIIRNDVVEEVDFNK